MDEVAAIATYLAGELSLATNGAALRVDGGRNCQSNTLRTRGFSKPPLSRGSSMDELRHNRPMDPEVMVNIILEGTLKPRFGTASPQYLLILRSDFCSLS